MVYEMTEWGWSGKRQAGAGSKEGFGQRTVLRAAIVEMLL